MSSLLAKEGYYAQPYQRSCNEKIAISVAATLLIIVIVIVLWYIFSKVKTFFSGFELPTSSDPSKALLASAPYNQVKYGEHSQAELTDNTYNQFLTKAYGKSRPATIYDGKGNVVTRQDLSQLH